MREEDNLIQLMLNETFTLNDEADGVLSELSFTGVMNFLKDEGFEPEMMKPKMGGLFFTLKTARHEIDLPCNFGPLAISQTDSPTISLCSTESDTASLYELLFAEDLGNEYDVIFVRDNNVACWVLGPREHHLFAKLDQLIQKKRLQTGASQTFQAA